jgi:uncharacterized membrane protein YeaQ/YmgE (transglycosylase-associated protein family)
MLGLIISAIVVGLIIGALGRLVLPGRQDMPIWLTILIGIVAALIGSLIASALGVGDTRGIDWIKLIIQVALAAAGVALVAGRYAPGRGRPQGSSLAFASGSHGRIVFTGLLGSTSNLLAPSRLGSWR